jgi:branched-chain amino acid transport system permease protein
VLTPYISVILNGIFIGGLYGLVACAWSFQVGALRFANFAYGASIMLSMYLTFFMIREWGIPIPVTVLLILAFNFGFGWLMRKTVLRGMSRSRMIICTMAVQLIVINVALFVFTAYPRDLSLLERRIYLAENISFGAIQFVCFIMSLIILLSFQFFLKRTGTGRAIRAVVQNREVATLMGINSEKILDIAYALSCILIGVAAMMLMLMNTVDVAYGNAIQSIAFMVCVLAGLGNLMGTFFSGIIVGVISALISYSIGSIYLNPIIYTLFVVILLIRPHGLFTKSTDIAKTL